MKKQICIMALVLLLSLNLVSALSITDVESYPQEIMPGETAEISIEIENTLNEDVTNVHVKLILTSTELEPEPPPFAPFQTSAERFIDELEEGEDETFEFKIIALPEASSGIHTIPVIISYYIEGGDDKQIDEGLISLIINSDVELKVFSEDSLLIREQESSFFVKIVNSGLSDIKFAYLTVEGVTGVRFISEKEQYIGDIDSDDFDNVEYKVYVTSGAPSIIKLPLTITYRDATNKEFEESKEIFLKVYSLKEAQKLGFVAKPKYTIFVGIGISVLLFLGYRIRKKRKLKAKK